MIVAKRIAILMASSAIAATLSGCEALDFLNFNSSEKEVEASAAAATTTLGATTAPAPMDLTGAQPMLPTSTMNTQGSAANAALIGSTMGASPSGFGAAPAAGGFGAAPAAAGFGAAPAAAGFAATQAPLGLAGLTPGMPTTTTTTQTYSYGAQPNPYAPRTVGGASQITSTPVTAPNIYGNSYQPIPQAGAAVTPSTAIVRAPSVAPLTAGLPSGAVSTTNPSSTTPGVPGTIDPANLSKSTITAIQTALKSRGLYSDVVDGVWGSNSKAAMNAYLATRGQSAVSLDTLFSLGVSL